MRWATIATFGLRRPTSCNYIAAHWSLFLSVLVSATSHVVGQIGRGDVYVKEIFPDVVEAVGTTPEVYSVDISVLIAKARKLEFGGQVITDVTVLL